MGDKGKKKANAWPYTCSFTTVSTNCGHRLYCLGEDGHGSLNRPFLLSLCNCSVHIVILFVFIRLYVSGKLKAQW